MSLRTDVSHDSQASVKWGGWGGEAPPTRIKAARSAAVDSSIYIYTIFIYIYIYILIYNIYIYLYVCVCAINICILYVYLFVLAKNAWPILVAAVAADFRGVWGRSPPTYP